MAKVIHHNGVQFRQIQIFSDSILWIAPPTGLQLHCCFVLLEGASTPFVWMANDVTVWSLHKIVDRKICRNIYPAWNWLSVPITRRGWRPTKNPVFCKSQTDTVMSMLVSNHVLYAKLIILELRSRPKIGNYSMSLKIVPRCWEDKRWKPTRRLFKNAIIMFECRVCSCASRPTVAH